MNKDTPAKAAQRLIQQHEVLEIGPGLALPTFVEIKAPSRPMLMASLIFPAIVGQVYHVHNPGEWADVSAAYKDKQHLVAFVPGYTIYIRHAGFLDKSYTCTPGEWALHCTSRLGAMAQHFASYVIPARAARYKRYLLPA